MHPLCRGIRQIGKTEDLAVIRHLVRIHHSDLVVTVDADLLHRLMQRLTQNAGVKALLNDKLIGIIDGDGIRIGTLAVQPPHTHDTRSNDGEHKNQGCPREAPRMILLIVSSRSIRLLCPARGLRPVLGAHQLGGAAGGGVGVRRFVVKR